MANPDNITPIIDSNKNDIAFIIGNGLHRYPDNKSLSWEQLLTDLWNSTQESKISSIPKGITYTEFYDILEMNCKKKSKERIESYSNSLAKYTISTIPMDVNTLQEKLYNRNSTKENFEQSMKQFDSYFSKHNIDEELQKFEKAKEILHREQITYELQLRIAELMTKWEPKLHHQRIAAKIMSYNAPILTTNYDGLISQSINADFFRLGKKNFSDIHPWSFYYSSSEINNPINDFGIWHINGTIQYPLSIKLGLSQYMSAVNKARKMVQGIGEVDNFDGKNRNNWIGENTWLHIVFNKSLFIFGLALEENEVFLRWLLIQRAMYFSKFPDRKYKGWFVIAEKDIEDENNRKRFEGKKFFLESVGIETIVVPSYKYLYEDIWL